MAIEKGYHALIYLTHEKLAREKAILQDLQSGRVDGVIMSITMETDTADHIRALHSQQVPLVFFDRVFEDVPTAKIITDDYNCGYEATRHLVECGCRNPALLSVSNSLSIISKRLEGYRQALQDHGIKEHPRSVILCSNDPVKNHLLLRKTMTRRNRPDGIVATVENLTTEIYQVCSSLSISIPGDLKVVCFSNLATAAILNPSLTTITQPAFEMGRMAATILFKALEKKNFHLVNESIVIPSALVIRNSTVGRNSLAGLTQHS